LPGLKVSNIIIPNQKLRSIFSKSCQSIGITQANCFGSIALEEAYNNCENWLTEAILYIQKNLEFLKVKAKVALFEGYLFGKGGKGFNRINLACPRSILERALNQMTKAIKDSI
jgi:cystathionine beta-lyase